ncbi:MAG: hypothetical protein LBH59_11010, partial [Planctomycetaceae bacterium]|nr:hypothetical protein [Planctomycetaceae bacterium]
QFAYPPVQNTPTKNPTPTTNKQRIITGLQLNTSRRDFIKITYSIFIYLALPFLLGTLETIGTIGTS